MLFSNSPNQLQAEDKFAWLWLEEEETRVYQTFCRLKFYKHQVLHINYELLGLEGLYVFPMVPSDILKTYVNFSQDCGTVKYSN